MTNNNLTTQMCANSNELRGFALTFTKNMEDANDLVQDTMIKAFKYADHFVAGTNLKAWMFTIMKNTFINNYRRATKRNSIMTVTDDFTSFQLTTSATQNHGEDSFKMQDIQKAMNKLRPEYSVPFLKYFEGYKYHEIADELDIPIGTVKTRIFLARKELMAQLKMYQEHFKAQTLARISA